MSVPDIAKLLTPNPFAGDDGSLSPQLAQAFAQPTPMRTAAVVRALDRIILPVVPHAHPGVDESGNVRDHTTAQTDPLAEDGSLVTVKLSADRAAVIVFSSAQALAAWNTQARPVPAASAAVAVAALKQNAGLIVLDPGQETETWLGRTAVISLASGGQWLAPWDDPQIAQTLGELAVSAGRARDDVALVPGERGYSVVEIHFPEKTQLSEVMPVAQAIGEGLEHDPYVRARLDVVEIRPMMR